MLLAGLVAIFIIMSFSGAFFETYFTNSTLSRLYHETFELGETSSYLPSNVLNTNSAYWRSQ